jgi:energy-coupling factor transporter ATP-binding protein EcfA2
MSRRRWPSSPSSSPGAHGHDPAALPLRPQKDSPHGQTDHGRCVSPSSTRSQVLCDNTVVKDVDLPSARRVRLAARAIGLRQDHDPAHGGRLRASPTAGRILVEGKDITGISAPNQRKIGMVFQAYALFPNMNVADNIGFGLKIAGKPRRDRGARRGNAVAHRPAPATSKRFPSSCPAASSSAWRWPAPSRQAAHAAARRAALGARRQDPRLAARADPRSSAKLGITTIFVTHDQEEALSISDRIVVMNAGNVEQVGQPFEIYNRPQTRFVADLRRHARTDFRFQVARHGD